MRTQTFFRLRIQFGAAVFCLLLFAASAQAGRLHKEREYQECWCMQVGGEAEYVLGDGCRVDCLTDEYAVEVDFADKWAEAVGQSLYYAYQTGRKPGVLLIMEEPGDDRYLKRFRVLAERYQIFYWTIIPDDLGAGKEN